MSPLYAVTSGSSLIFTTDHVRGYAGEVSNASLATTGARIKLEKLAAMAVPNTTSSSNVPLYTIVAYDATTRRLATLNPLTGSVSIVSSTVLTFHPQCKQFSQECYVFKFNLKLNHWQAGHNMKCFDVGDKALR